MKKKKKKEMLVAGRPRCPIVPPRRRGSARPMERGGGRTQGETDPRGGGAGEAPAGHGSRPARRRRRRSARRPRRWIRRRAAAGSARRPKERGIPAAAALKEARGRFRGRRPEGRRAARIRDGGTRRSAVPRPRRPGEVARALPPSLAQLRRATAARDLTEREDGEKGERKKGAERGEDRRKEESGKKRAIGLRGVDLP